MFNLLVIAKDTTAVEKYLGGLAERKKISPASIFHFGQEETLGVSEIRQILKLTERHFSQPCLIVLHRFDKFSHIIQNTFLKPLEEHPHNLSFVLIAKNRANILPTVASRCRIVLVHHTEKKELASNPELKNILNKLFADNPPPASSLIKLGIKNKKERALSWLDSFLEYGYSQLPHSKKRLQLAARLKQALYQRNLIENNNLEPELALDHIFFFG